MENILRKPELSNIQQISTVSLMSNSTSMFMFRLANVFCNHMEMPYFSPGVKNMASVKCHISVKKSLERIVWSTSNEYRERKLHLTGFISKEEMETGEDCLIPMSHLGLGS